MMTLACIAQRGCQQLYLKNNERLWWDIHKLNGEVHTIVALVAFDKTPAIDINDLALCTIFASQHVKATDPLPKTFTNLICPGLFLLG